MKLKIKVKRLGGVPLPSVIDKGEWVDLYSRVHMEIPKPSYAKKEITFHSNAIPLGVAMKLPAGFEAIVAPRSSTFKNFGIIQSNSIGVIDNSYSGNNDEWKMPVVALKDAEIDMGDRVCQFRIQLSQKATLWQKIKWLLSSGIKVVEVENLDSEDRGGFGSTGVK